MPGKERTETNPSEIRSDQINNGIFRILDIRAKFVYPH
jgi:hypothetical protein